MSAAALAAAQAKDVVFQDDFARQGHIFKSVPAPLNGPQTTWTDNLGAGGMITDGSSLLLDRLDLASLPYDSSQVPESGLATISADLEVKTGWALFGFTGSNNAFDKDVGAFASVCVFSDGKITFGKGKGSASVTTQAPSPGQSVHIDITLDYGANHAAFFVNGTKAGDFSYAVLPGFNQIFVLGSEGGSSHVRHFSLSLERKDTSPVAVKIPDGNTPLAKAPPVFFLSGSHESAFASEWLDGMKQAATGAGFSSAAIKPADLLAQGMPANGILVVHRRSDLLGALTAVLGHMRQGGAVWLAGTEDYFNTGSDKAIDTSEIYRLLEGAPFHLDPEKMTSPYLTKTEESHQLLPLPGAAIVPGHVTLLSENQSEVMPSLPPWVKVTPLLEVKYKSKNWVNLDDIFTGWVVGLLEHTGGPFKGARLLYTGFAVDGKVFNPRNDLFYPLVAASLKLLAQPVDLSHVAALNLPKPRAIPERSNFFHAPAPSFAPLNIGGAEVNNAFWEDLAAAGFNGFHTGIPWIVGEKDPMKSVDWAKLDHIMAGAKEHKFAVIIDPYAFEWFQGKAIAWGGNHSLFNQEFRAGFSTVMKAVVERYKDNPYFVALFATPHTGFGIFTVDRSPEALQAWQTYLTTKKGWTLEQINSRYGLSAPSIDKVPIPSDTTKGTYNFGPAWADFIPFQLEALQNFNVETIDLVRQVIPGLPILMRGGYFDSAINMDVASRYKDVATHSECIETSSDMESYYRGEGARFNVPYSAENGWCTIRGGPLRVNFACYLLGGYNDFFYSFAGPVWTLPSGVDFARAEKAADTIRQDAATYGHSDLAIMIADTTLFAHFPQDIMRMEFTANIEYTMEQLGFTYEAISAQIPRWNGLRVIMDNGMNVVLTRKTADELVAWIKAGGTFIAFPDSGKIILEGDEGGLSAKLGVDLRAVKGTQQQFSVGGGTVIVLPSVPAENQLEMGKLSQLFSSLKVRQDFAIEPFINQASYAAKGKKYLVIGSKSRQYVGAFFHESTLKGMDAIAHDIPLTITPNFPFSHVRNVADPDNFKVEDGKVKMAMKAHDFTVLEFTTP